MTRRQSSALYELFWSALYLVLAGAIIANWTSEVPAWVLWAGYVSGAIAVVLLVRWFLDNVR